MAPTAQEKVSVDARGVLIMIVALAGIAALWVNGECVQEPVATVCLS